MKLSRKWLHEFVDIANIGDREFSEAMTLSGSKTEATAVLNENIKNIVAGRIEAMERHPDSDHMWVCQVNIGKPELVQIVTGAWNVHAGDLVPVAVHNAVLPNGKKITKGKLRGILSNGMLCSLRELNLTAEHDFPYAIIKPAALLHDYHAIDKNKPSIPEDINPGEVEKIAYNRRSVILDTGEENNIQPELIETDLSNIHVGDLVAYDIKAKKICGLDDLHAKQEEFPHCITDGIWILNPEDKDCKPGDDIAGYIGADDHVVEFEITPNRPDCLSVIGLAREAAATFDKDLKLHEPKIQGGAGDIGGLLDIEIEDGDLCARYTARLVKNVKIKPSPAWMRERLRNSGVRPINNIVDITNYVMLEYGQPMHAFDFSCVDGGNIVVRTAREGESVETLDGNIRKLTPDMLCICDENKPVAVAGVMGGANSEILGDTDMVLFESANFNGASVRRTATALNMRTEASSRFEKGLDPLNTLKAVNRACELVELLDAGEVLDGVVDAIARDSAAREIKLEPDKINQLLGTDIAESDMRRILTPLGFELDGDMIRVPSWRGDVEGCADIAEEVARFYGYNLIPNTLSAGLNPRRGLNARQKFENRLGALCRSLGYHEILTYSFISPSYYNKIHLPEKSILRDSLKILNPLGEDTSIMRTAVLPSMLEVLTRNYNLRNQEACLYELGRVYFPKEDQSGLADELKRLSLGAYGQNMDFFALKGAIENILSGLRIENTRYIRDLNNNNIKIPERMRDLQNAFHPGRSAWIVAGNKILGVFGQIHPAVSSQYGVDREIYAAEISCDDLFENIGPEPVYHSLPRFPAVTRDIALICAKELPVGDLKAVIYDASAGLLQSAAIFDVYTGTGIPEDKKSVAFSLTFRADDRSLTASEADEEVKAILKRLRDDLNAVLR